MKKYKATWVQDNPFEGDRLHSCSQVVEVEDDFPLDILEGFAKRSTPDGYVFRDLVEVPMSTPVTEKCQEEP